MEVEDLNAEEEESEDKSGPDFNYILNMALWCLSKEKKDELLKQRDDKAEELYQLRKKSREDLWRKDLDDFLQELDVCTIFCFCKIRFSNILWLKHRS